LPQCSLCCLLFDSTRFFQFSPAIFRQSLDSDNDYDDDDDCFDSGTQAAHESVAVLMLATVSTPTSQASTAARDVKGEKRKRLTVKEAL
jgi:hypothetical protein